MADEKKDRLNKENEDIDEASEESFPASDPPSFSAGSATPVDPDDDKRYPGHLDHDEDIEEDERT